MRLSTFRENDNVLLVGEGNFSFAVSLVKHNLPIVITASCYESSVANEITRNNVDFLRAHGIRILLGVDATKLSEHEFLNTKSYDKIIFNFPHVGGKMRLDKNRELLQQFFVSARHFLKPDGEILMTLCDGQGGSMADKPKRRWDDSWKVTEMAAHGNFVLSLVEPFEASTFRDYTPTGYRGLEKQFNVSKSLTHIFKQVLSPSTMDLAPIMKLDLSQLKIADEKIQYADIFSNSKEISLFSYSPTFLFDVTFSVGQDFREFDVYIVLYNFAGRIVRDVEFVGSFRFPNGKITRTYRITYRSKDIPLYRKRIVNWHCQFITQILEDNLSVIVTR